MHQQQGLPDSREPREVGPIRVHRTSSLPPHQQDDVERLRPRGSDHNAYLQPPKLIITVEAQPPMSTL
jgi:hypothetical protein